MAQLDRATDFGSVGWGFDSLRTCYWLTLNQGLDSLGYAGGLIGRVLELVDKADLGSVGGFPVGVRVPSRPSL